ncbi:hypothetical protein OUZ56_017702 [Daphnia magna]|uniref:Uncharacterized protein n=1 Tax=Daphnia magna TaxID=35525 RepID=A0ABR0ATI6_9CRUS|nr:hypothetical protein OUZ56_017702 [Daphnia magna]
MDSEAKAEALLTELKNNKLAKVAAGESSNVAKVHVPVQRTLSELDWAGEAQLEGEALVEPPSQTSLPNKMMEQGPKQYFPERSHWLPLPRFIPPGPGAIPKTKPISFVAQRADGNAKTLHCLPTLKSAELRKVG